MAETAKNKEVSVAEKLDALFELQKIDSEIDRIRTVRGELPLEVQDLEDQIEGIETRIKNFQDELKSLEQEVSDRKNAIKDSETNIQKYKEQQNNVRNNREYESLDKEIEFQSLEIKLHEKKSKEAKYLVGEFKTKIEKEKEHLETLKSYLVVKKSELDEIINETKKEEDVLTEKSSIAKEKIDDRLVFAYDRLRENAKNGLAVVPVDRDSCGGCFNKIPPQRQLDIQTKKKIIVCEHCGRILVPSVL